jgi:hypothetical protein
MKDQKPTNKGTIVLDTSKQSSYMSSDHSRRRSWKSNVVGYIVDSIYMASSLASNRISFTVL